MRCHSQSDAPNRHAYPLVGGCWPAIGQIGGAKNGVGDGAASSELKAPFVATGGRCRIRHTGVTPPAKLW